MQSCFSWKINVWNAYNVGPLRIKFALLHCIKPMVVTLVHQNSWSLGQSERCDPPPHLDSEFQFCAHGAQVWRKTSKLISSSPRGWKIEDRQGELHDLRERAMRTFKRWFEWGLIPPRPLLFFYPILSNRFKPHTSDHCPAVVLWQPKKRWTARARSGMNGSQGAWHEGVVGEKDLC